MCGGLPKGQGRSEHNNSLSNIPDSRVSSSSKEESPAELSQCLQHFRVRISRKRTRNLSPTWRVCWGDLYTKVTLCTARISFRFAAQEMKYLHTATTHFTGHFCSEWNIARCCCWAQGGWVEEDHPPAHQDAAGAAKAFWESVISPRGVVLLADWMLGHLSAIFHQDCLLQSSEQSSGSRGTYWKHQSLQTEHKT